MAVFSRRNGYNTSALELECTSDTLKRRIMAAFYKQEFDPYDPFNFDNYTTGIEDMMVEMGVAYQFPKNNLFKQKNAEELQKYVLGSKEWYIIFDFIERYLSICDEQDAVNMSSEFNRILEDEASAYRIVNNWVVPITNESELATIREATNHPYDSVHTHITKALSLFSDRKKPDYENSIKESISAVEAICCIITGLSGANATLGKVLKKLKDHGVHIHPAMENAFSSLYGYTSDEEGIRHGGIDFRNAPSEDAKYMLVSCSAFVNYLIEKWTKAKGES